MKELELRPADKYHYRRSHAWVAIIDNAPWSIQPKKTIVNENGDTCEEQPEARFIEPSTGLFFDSDCKNYILIDSVWNNSQYYVNKQKCSHIGEMKWDFRNTGDWEHLLPGEPIEMRTHDVGSEENINSVSEEKHLDIIKSWVSRLYIGEREFEERFPELQKTIWYKQSKYERFSPYSQRDGKIMQLTLYEDNKYQNPTIRREYYKNRADLLVQIKFNYMTMEIEEIFEKGRNDSLKCKLKFS